MTTNRVMTIDPAMVSRIHYALALGALDKEQEARIWKSYTKQLKPENCNEISKIKDWVGLKTKKKISEMNGRQIRNLFTTAQALAEGELAEGYADSTGKVALEHLKRINETMTTFRDDMQGLLIWAKADAAKSSN
jgi:ATP-dependent 26S proteasome regulatory subunit